MKLIVFIVEMPTGVEPIYHDIPEELRSHKNGYSYDRLDRNPTQKVNPHYQSLEQLDKQL